MGDLLMRDGRGVHTKLSQGEGCREDLAGAGQWQQTRQRYDKLPNSRIYTTWAGILSDRNVFCTLRGGGKTAGSNAPGAFLVLVVIEYFQFILMH